MTVCLAVSQQMGPKSALYWSTTSEKNPLGRMGGLRIEQKYAGPVILSLLPGFQKCKNSDAFLQPCLFSDFRVTSISKIHPISCSTMPDSYGQGSQGGN